MPTRIKNLARKSLEEVVGAVPECNIGQMIKVCEHCSALLFPDEEKVGICCSKGKVAFPEQPKIPMCIKTLLTQDTAKAIEFRKNIRKYNSAFAFASLGVKYDRELASQRQGVYTFRISGQLCHLMGSLLPEEGESAKFSQIYMLDDEYQAGARNAVSINYTLLIVTM